MSTQENGLVWKQIKASLREATKSNLVKNLSLLISMLWSSKTFIIHLIYKGVYKTN